jgi:hypothetical protein
MQRLRRRARRDTELVGQADTQRVNKEHSTERSAEDD